MKKNKTNCWPFVESCSNVELGAIHTCRCLARGGGLGLLLSLREAGLLARRWNMNMNSASEGCQKGSTNLP